MLAVDDCPFNRVPMEIAIMIIEQLSLQSRKCLALTCRKWYETLNLLPDSKKCVLMERFVNLEVDGFARLTYSPVSTIIRTPQTKFNLVQKLAFDQLWIRGRELCKKGNFTSKELFNYLNENRSHFEIDRFRIAEPFKEEDLMLLDSVADIPSNVLFYICNANSEDLNSAEKLVNIDKDEFFRKHLSHKSIDLRMVTETGTINNILKQWVRGERPNLLNFECMLNSDGMAHNWETLENTVNRIVDGLDHYVGEKTNTGIVDRPVLSCIVTVPDIGLLKIKLSRNHCGVIVEK